MKLSPEQYRRKWGVPDWRDASAYSGRLIWRWEFLRRREDYRRDYERARAATIKWYNSHTPEDFAKGLSPTGENRIYPDNWEGPEGIRFCVEMAGSIEKYNLRHLPNPAIARPRYLSFEGYLYAFNTSVLDWKLQNERNKLLRFPILLSINPAVGIEEHVKFLKIEHRIAQKRYNHHPLPERPELWSIYLRALDAEAEKVSYAEICRALDPKTRRSRNRGDEILRAAHSIQNLITRPI